MQLAPQLAIAPKFDVDPFVKRKTDEIEWLLNGAGFRGGNDRCGYGVRHEKREELQALFGTCDLFGRLG